MEHKLSIVDKWRFFSLGTLCGFLVFVIYFDKVHQNISFFATKRAFVNLASFALQNPLNQSNLIGTKKKCDIFDGRWVYKPEERPWYDSSMCPLVSRDFKCQENGRPDSKYEKWRWEARDCDIPEFNGTYMLERLRNKKMIIVGDSINRNMWESLACLLFTSVPSYVAKVDEHRRFTNSWVAKEHNFTLEFFWSAFLVDIINTNHESGKKVLVLDKPPADSDKWIGADIMVFNTGHWWEQQGKYRRWDLFELEGKLIEDMPLQQSFERAMTTWATWIERNVDPNKTTVFFRAYSPVHLSRQYCYNRTQPIMNDSFERKFPKYMVDTVESLITGLSNSKVKYLNTTKLTEYRIDAHPSIYLIPKDEKKPNTIADCSHWCLPGVPDVWNRLLYASLFF